MGPKKNFFCFVFWGEKIEYKCKGQYVKIWIGEKEIASGSSEVFCVDMLGQIFCHTHLAHSFLSLN